MNEAYFKARAALQARKAGRMGDYADYLREQADGYAALQKNKEVQRLRTFGDDSPLRPVPDELLGFPAELDFPDGEVRHLNSRGLIGPLPGTPEFLEYAGVYGEPVIEVFTPNGAEGYTLTPLSGKTGKSITERGAKALQTKHEKMLAEKRGVIQPANESHVWNQK